MTIIPKSLGSDDIQWAINEANNGDVIQLPEGVGHIHHRISLWEKRLEIRGFLDHKSVIITPYPQTLFYSCGLGTLITGLNFETEEFHAKKIASEAEEKRIKDTYLDKPDKSWSEWITTDIPMGEDRGCWTLEELYQLFKARLAKELVKGNL